MTVLDHAADCAWHVDQRDADCDCGSQIKAWTPPGLVPNRIMIGAVPDYLTENWVEKLRLSAPHARRLGMQLLQHAAAAEVAAVSDYETRPCDVEVE